MLIIHSIDVVQCYIEPENVLLNNAFEPVVTGFGMIRLTSALDFSGPKRDFGCC
jgi:hypothetical protein